MNDSNISTILTSLNEEQQKAASFCNGPMLIVAGAGTGKTKLIMSRIMNLVSNFNVSPANILAITFTNKAAQEMKDRAVRMQIPKSNELNISTFHGLCLKILKRYYSEANLPYNFIVLDEEDRCKLIRSTLKEIGVESKSIPLKAIVNYISRLKESIAAGTQSPNKPLSLNPKVSLEEIYKLYSQKISESGFVDFDDLIKLTIEMLQSNPKVLDEIQDAYKFIMVDEYQDTSTSQHKLIKILSQKHKNICCVGDDDQSIYGWRGAKVENMLDFQNTFVGAPIIRLEKNYRSSSAILHTANCVISNNISRHKKILIPKKELSKSDKVQIVLSDSERDENEKIANVISTLSYHDTFNSVAILVRSSSQIASIEGSLNKHRIPYIVVDGIKFFERKEVKDIISYVRAAYSDHDYIAIERSISCTKNGIGIKTIEEIINLFKSGLNEVNSSIITSVRAFAQKTSNLKKQSELEKYASLLEKCRQILKENDDSCIKNLLEVIFFESGYKEYLEQSEPMTCSAKINRIVDMIDSVSSEFSDLDEFLNHISIAADRENMDTSAGLVRIMTMHSAKGLEFENVILPGWEEGTFPSYLSLENSENAVEEERRLAYVAITRAKRRLMIFGSKKRLVFGKLQERMISRFIFEIAKNKDDRYQNFIGNLSNNNETRKLRTNSDFGLYETKSNSYISSGDSVMHKLFGKGIAIKQDGVYISVEFENGTKKVIHRDFLFKNN